MINSHNYYLTLFPWSKCTKHVCWPSMIHLLCFGKKSYMEKLHMLPLISFFSLFFLFNAETCRARISDDKQNWVKYPMAPWLADPARSSQLVTTGKGPAKSRLFLAHCWQCQVHIWPAVADLVTDRYHLILCLIDVLFVQTETCVGICVYVYVYV